VIEYKVQLYIILFHHQISYYHMFFMTFVQVFGAWNTGWPPAGSASDSNPAISAQSRHSHVVQVSKGQGTHAQHVEKKSAILKT
jgi:hypothetical protein